MEIYTGKHWSHMVAKRVKSFCWIVYFTNEWRQICSLLNCALNSITVKSLPVQQQTGGVDCGLFPIAFLEFIARTNTNPENVSFDQSKFRNHALLCLKDDKIYPFPVANCHYKIRSAVKEFKLKLYCECRMIWTPSDSRVDGK